MEWGIVYYETKAGDVPADDFLDACPTKVEATILAVLEAVRAAPAPTFSGGGKWEAMHGDMAATTRSVSRDLAGVTTACSVCSTTAAKTS